MACIQAMMELAASRIDEPVFADWVRTNARKLP
jgi:hypothetical protein